MKNKRPPKCCHPNCFECPYTDCRYDRLEAEDYTETNNRDYELYEADTGYKLHRPADKEYRSKRQTAYQRGNRKYVDMHEYNQKYYQEHGEEIKAKKRANYDTKKNTIQCRKYRKKNIEKRKSYEREYYLKHAEEKRQKAREAYYRKKEMVQCT